MKKNQIKIIMKFRHIFLTMLLFVCTAAQAQMPNMQMPADPDVKVGKLDNGLTYYIRHNNWPEHRANFYIAQKVGSLQEEENQRGLAHFLEHMCFNGTTHFKGNEVTNWCEKQGISFGGDLNAYTSIEETVYRICNVPTDNQARLDTCLIILADWADGLLLEPEEIDKERGVIHEEWRLRTSATSRMLERNLEALYPGSKYGRRYPIGLMSVVDNFKPQELRDYYEKWYHPTNQGIIVVGDVDVDHTEKMIKEYFGGIKNPDPVAAIERVEVPDNAEPIVIIDKDKEEQASIAEVIFKHDAFPDSLNGTMVYVMQQYVSGAAMSMLNNRFTEVAQQEGCPFVSANAEDGEYVFSKTKEALTLSAMPKDMSKTADAVKLIIVEARRAAEYGFTATEYSRFKADYLSMLEKQYTNRDKRTNDQLYQPLVRNFLEGKPMPSIDVTYQLMNQIVPAIPLEAINEYMKELVPQNDSNLVIVSFNNEAEGATYPTRDGLLGAVKEARTMPVEAYVDNVKNEPLITNLPKAGTIKKETRNEKLGYTKLELSNGVNVFLKQTDFKKDQVLLEGVGPGAQSLYGEKDYRNLQMFDDVIGISGLGNFSSTELEKALAGKIANANLTMGNKYMSIDGSSTPKDVETMLQMVYLYFTNINKDEKSYQKLMNQYEVALKNRALSPEIALSDSLTATLYGHNPRLAPMTVEALKDVSYDRILEIARERTATAKGWNISIVGNFDEATIRPLICQYIASLPAKKKPTTSKRVKFLQKGKITNAFKRKQETPKCTAYEVWYSEDVPYTLETSIQADMVGQLMRMAYTKEIREEASAAYSVMAAGAASKVDDYELMQFFAMCPMKPEKKEIAMELLNKAVNDMTTTCDQERLDKVKELMLKEADDQQKQNRYWLNVIDSQERNGIDMHTNYKSLVQSQTPSKISNFVKEVLKSGNNITVMMLPE